MWEHVAHLSRQVGSKWITVRSVIASLPCSRSLFHGRTFIHIVPCQAVHHLTTIVIDGDGSGLITYNSTVKHHTTLLTNSLLSLITIDKCIIEQARTQIHYRCATAQIGRASCRERV